VGRSLALVCLTLVCLVGLTACDAFAGSAPHRGATGYTVDALKMVDACQGGRPIYWAPDGTYWVWRDGWRPVARHTGGDC
jgi:hypothetical protein